MEWHITDAQSLAIIDREIGAHTFSPAEYEIVRRVIYATADYDYKNLIRFSDTALQDGATALAARNPIIVDSAMVQAGIAPLIQHTFINPVYSAIGGHTQQNSYTHKNNGKSAAAWGVETLAQRYPEAIFIIGESQTALHSLIELIEAAAIKPALVITAPTHFLQAKTTKKPLSDSSVPHIDIASRKGNASVATALTNGLVELAWQAYGDANIDTIIA